MSENKQQILEILHQVFDDNSQLILVSLSSPTGLPIISLERNENSEITEVEMGASNRFAALSGASYSLADRTMSTFSEEKTKLINFRGNKKDCSISISTYAICLIVTQPSGSSHVIAEKLNATLKGVV